MIRAFEQRGINWVDGMTPMMEARSIKSPNEQKAMRMVGSICDVTHYNISQWIKPGVTENEVTAFTMEYLYNFPAWRTSRTSSCRPARTRGPTGATTATASSARRHRDHRPRGAHVERLQVAACTGPTALVGSRPPSTSSTTTWRRSGCGTRSSLVKPGVTTADIAACGRRPRRSGATRKRTRLPPTSGVTDSARPVRPAGHLADLVARSSPGDPRGHGLRPRDPARQAPRLRCAARRDARRHDDRSSRCSPPSRATRSSSPE